MAKCSFCGKELKKSVKYPWRDEECSCQEERRDAANAACVSEEVKNSPVRQMPVWMGSKNYNTWEERERYRAGVMRTT